MVAKHMHLIRPLFFIIVISVIYSGGTHAQSPAKTVKQPAEVIEAYRVCEQFQRILSERLDFSAAYEATFITNAARRRALAIKEGEFNGADFTRVDDTTLINAYKSRMQLLYLTFPLMSPSDEEERRFFPPQMKEIFDRKAPNRSEEFGAFAAQLDQDARNFRAHLEKLASTYPEVAERVRKFKSDLVTGDFHPPKTSVVKPLTFSGGGDVLSNGESYYQIEGYTVVRENGRMKIAGIRLLTRLF